ncbi:MAG: hypothetical protein FWH33_06170 [Oscillospiraceae bacterium]|nr:hypothetical protein [Oscillospiraceae bacterium]
MDRIGLLDSVIISEADIAQGRIWLNTDGMEREGRISYQRGLTMAIDTFKTVQKVTSEDLELVILAEYTFIAQELALCDPMDSQATSSLKNAMQSFDDAFLALEAIADITLYKGAEMTHPHSAKYRIKDMPKDAFHIMCIAHRARLNNILKSPGINLSEKNLLIQRLENINAAQLVYLDKQERINYVGSGETNRSEV